MPSPHGEGGSPGLDGGASGHVSDMCHLHEAHVLGYAYGTQPHPAVIGNTQRPSTWDCVDVLLDVRVVDMIFQCYAWFSTELASNKHLGKHSRTYFQMDASDACAFSSPSAPSTLACPAACGLSSWHSASKLSSRSESERWTLRSLGTWPWRSWFAFWVAMVVAITAPWNYTLIRFFTGCAGGTFATNQFWCSLTFARNVVGTANAIAAGWGILGSGVTQIFMMSVLFSLTCETQACLINARSSFSEGFRSFGLFLLRLFAVEQLVENRIALTQLLLASKNARLVMFVSY